MPGTLTHNSYGKSAVRLTKVLRDGPVHELFEIEATIQLEGDFGPAYTAGDNRNVVATDSVKNTVYVAAAHSGGTPRRCRPALPRSLERMFECRDCCAEALHVQNLSVRATTFSAPDLNP